MSTVTNLSKWKPESPFLQEDSYETVQGSREDLSRYEVSQFQSPFNNESPFQSSYGYEGESYDDPQIRAFSELVADMYDPEFDDVVGRFMQELYGVVAREIDVRGLTTAETADLEAIGFDLIRPIGRELEAALDRMANEVGNLDAGGLSEHEIDQLFVRYAPVAYSRENFDPFKLVTGLVNKAKTVVKAVAKSAGKILPLKQILGTIKQLVVPLLNRVLRFAIDKLPAAVRPAARKLAKMLPVARPTGSRRHSREAFYDESPEFTALEGGMATAPDPAEIQSELDISLAACFLQPQAFEGETALDPMPEEPLPKGSSLHDLDRARQAFAQNVTRLAPGESAAPLIEQFIPAVLAAAPVVIAAAKTAIGLIGRERVVNLIATGMIAPMIQKWVGPDASALSQAVVSTGLGLIGLEIPPPTDTRLAGEVLASTVEDTVHRLAEAVEQYNFDASDLENPVILEALTLEAFEAAATANFPPEMLRPDLRETSFSNATWVLLPREGVKRYKKYTEILSVQLEPQAASRIRTFGGSTLAHFLQEVLRLPHQPIKANIHLYEAIPGTWLSRITLNEKNVPGLGTATARAWRQLHPLTVEAASILMGRPGLGRDVNPRFMQSRHRIRVGQRFYFLEIPGARWPDPPNRHRVPSSSEPSGPTPIQPPVTEPDQPSQANVTIDCLKKEIRIHLYFSEEVSQKRIAAALRENAPMSSILRIITGVAAGIATSIALGPSNHVRIIREMEDLAPLAGLAAKGAKFLLEQLAEKVIEWVLKNTGEYLERKAIEFKSAFLQAADSPAKGVTLTLVLSNPPGMDTLCDVLNGKLTIIPKLPVMVSVPSATVTIRAGLFRD